MAGQVVFFAVMNGSGAMRVRCLLVEFCRSLMRIVGHGISFPFYGVLCDSYHVAQFDLASRASRASSIQAKSSASTKVVSPKSNFIRQSMPHAQSNSKGVFGEIERASQISSSVAARSER